MTEPCPRRCGRILSGLLDECTCDMTADLKAEADYDRAAED